jgi:hypothetical protein
MFVFAIETQGHTVAFVRESNRIMLEGVLNGQTEDGQHLRNALALTRDTRWDGSSPFAARLATESEEADYNITAHEHLGEGDDDESPLMFYFKNPLGEKVLAVPPALR